MENAVCANVTNQSEPTEADRARERDATWPGRVCVYAFVQPPRAPGESDRGDRNAISNI